MHRPAHVWRLPPEANSPDDFEWVSVGVLQHQLRACRVPHDTLRKMLTRWTQKKRLIDKEWLRLAEARHAEIALVVDRERREQLLADQRAAELESNRLDAIETERIKAQLVEAYLVVEARIRLRKHRKVAKRLRNQDREIGLRVSLEKLERLGKAVHRETVLR